MSDKKLNRYLYELYSNEGKKIKDTIDAYSLFEAFNLIDGEFGLDDGMFKDVSIELLRKDIE